MDKNGRINIPPYLREVSGLTKQIALVGMSNKFEVWDDISWEQEMADDDDLDLSPELQLLSI
jgi:MraZ protein